jgi:hypothetical protein
MDIHLFITILVPLIRIEVHNAPILPEIIIVQEKYAILGRSDPAALSCIGGFCFLFFE